MTLSKSNYIFYLQHPAYLWLKNYEKNKLPPLDDNTQDIFDAGNLFESYAEKLYPTAEKIGFDFNNKAKPYNSMPERTKLAMDKGAPVILQGRLEANNITCIFDVLRKVENTDGNVYDLVEIKSSSSAKVEHHYDLAFQKLVLEGAGLKVRNCSVIHLNDEYVRNGEIELEKLTKETDITQEVNALGEITKEQVKDALNVLDLDSCPDLSPRYINKLGVIGTKWKDYWMDIFFYIKKDLPKTSIYNLCRLTPELVGILEDLNITDIKDIPEDLENLHPRQVTQIQATKTDKQIIDKEKIAEFLNTFKYPLYFFDYETLSSVVPLYDGMSGYKDYPFQYSLHILDSPEAELRHEEYLHDEKSNPMPKLIEKMKKDIGDEGTILAWNMSYEKSCNTRMAEVYPEHADFLLQINERIKDLMTPFSEMWFIDKDFLGSASIKNVLPVVVPELSYKEMDVSDGLKARRLWTKTILGDANIWDRENILNELRAYCTLDTFAMVRILRELEKLVLQRQ